MSTKSPIYMEYFAKQFEFQRQYGERTCVLLMMGKFYEMYTYDPDLDEEKDDLDEKWNAAFKDTFRKQQHNILSLSEKEKIQKFLPQKRKKIGYALEIGELLDCEIRLHKKRSRDGKRLSHSIRNP